METQRTTLSFLTESMSSAVGLSAMRRVAMTLLVMLLTTVSAIAQDNYWLTLDANYDSGTSRMIPVSSFNPTRTLTQDDVPIRAGHTFIGWSETPTGDAAYFTGNAVTLSGNLTLYAIWDKTYTLTLDANYEGGATTMIPVIAFSPTYTLTQGDVPTREGHTFKGWAGAPTESYQYSTGYTITLSGDLTLYAIWDDSPCPFKLTYTITNENLKQVEMSGCGGDKPAGTLSIPATAIINGDEYSVTSIGYSAFRACENLKSVTIPNSVTSIGNNAFAECYHLTSVTIPNSVTSIGNSAFSWCELKSVTIPNSVTSIGESAFRDCSSLQSVTIPNSVTSIGGSAFEACSGLRSVTLNSNPKIGTNAFLNTPAIVTMNLTASNVNEDKWTTFYNSSFNFQADGNTKVYKGTVDGSSLVLTEVEDRIVNKGTAVILKSTDNPVMTLTGSNSSDTNGNDLRGYSDRSLLGDVMYWNGGSTIYTMGNTSAGFGFHKYTGEYVPAQKAFLPLNTANGAKAILTMVFADVTTGVNELQVSNDQQPVYDLNGRKVSENNLKPGVYVKNGKKIMIK